VALIIIPHINAAMIYKHPKPINIAIILSKIQPTMPFVFNWNRYKKKTGVSTWLFLFWFVFQLSHDAHQVIRRWAQIRKLFVDYRLSDHFQKFIIIEEKTFFYPWKDRIHIQMARMNYTAKNSSKYTNCGNHNFFFLYSRIHQ